MPDLLIEIGCEDLPAVACREAERQVPGLLADGLDRLGLDANTVGVHVSPRRIAAIATGLPAERAAKRAEVRGPKVDAPEQARAGFARKHGLEVDDLIERDGLVWAISDGAATPVAELVPGSGGAARRCAELLQVDAVGSRPLLASGAVAGGQARRPGGAGRAVRSGRKPACRAATGSWPARSRWEAPPAIAAICAPPT